MSTYDWAWYITYALVAAIAIYGLRTNRRYKNYLSRDKPEEKPVAKPKFESLNGRRWSWTRTEETTEGMRYSNEVVMCAMLQEIADHNIKIIELLGENKKAAEEQTAFLKKVFGER